MCRYTISAETLRAAQALRVLKQASNTPTQLLGWVSISKASCTWQTSKVDFQPR
jgi:hypothetical protein